MGIVSITTATMATEIKTPSSTPSSLSLMPVSLRAGENHASDSQNGDGNCAANSAAVTSATMPLARSVGSLSAIAG